MLVGRSGIAKGTASFCDGVPSGPAEMSTRGALGKRSRQRAILGIEPEGNGIGRRSSHLADR